MSKTNALKRIINKDIKSIKENNLEDLGIFVRFNEDNLMEANVMIVGPKDSIYFGGYLFFKLKFPNNYPFSPPDVAYISRNNIRIHPNMYVGHHSSGHGKVCLSILGTWSGPKWTSIMDICSVLITLQSLLDSNPLLHEPGITNVELCKNFRDIIYYENIKTLIFKNLTDIPNGYEEFKSIMVDQFKKNKEDIKNNILKNKTSKYIINFKVYNIKNYKLDYQKLIEDFNNLILE